MINILTKRNRRACAFWALLLILPFFLMAFIIPKENETTASESVREEGYGTIKGKVVYKGGYIRNEKNTIKDEHTCGMGAIIDESLLSSDDGGLKWAVVSIVSDIKNGKNLDALQTDGTLDQSTCVFKPHVVVVGVNKPLVVVNNDKTLHNVRTVSFMNDPISKAQIAFPGSPIPRDTFTFTEPEIVETVCDVHGWMKAYIHVVDHPYHVVTGDNGSFQMENVPSGKYTLKVWHESLGESEQVVTVLPNKTIETNFFYKEKKK